MEHVAHIVEAVLALFGGLKFCHECYEVLHHAVHFAAKLKK
jgi:hypothetical protein